MKLSRIIVKHREKCFMKNKDNPWSGLTDGYYCGNFAANKDSKYHGHIWHRVTCNDPNCPAIKAVHSSILANA
jgi:hypothetical protein